MSRDNTPIDLKREGPGYGTRTVPDDFSFECVSCGDDEMNAPQPVPYEPALYHCCCWECYAILLKCKLADKR